jgi:mycofactocin glycosyltransferase
MWFRFLADPDVQRHVGTDRRTVLLGGQPLRLLRLAPRSIQLHDSLVAGATLADAATDAGLPLPKAQAFVRRLLDAGVLHPDPSSASRTGHNSPNFRPKQPELDGVVGSDQPTADEVTIVIPVKDRAVSLDRLLNAIATLRPAPANVIVVDDGSTDATADIARRHAALVIRHDTSRGPAAARNTGAKAATTNLIAFIDSDCVPAIDWLDGCLPHFADLAVVAVAPRIVALNNATNNRTALRAYESVRSALDLGPRPGPVVPRSRIAYVPSATLIVRRDAFTAISGFDETLHVGEDVDAIWRLHKNGGTIRYEPRATVAHDHRDSVREFARRRAQYGTSAAPLAARHPGDVPPIVLSPWTATVWACAATQTTTGMISALTIAEITARQLPSKLTGVLNATTLGRRLARRGHLGTGRQLASALARTYLPIAAVAAFLSRRARRALLAAAVIPNVLEWRERRPTLDPVRYVCLRILEDASYCTGVWIGCAHERTFAPLRPAVVNWPGRRKVTEDS